MTTIWFILGLVAGILLGNKYRKDKKENELAVEVNPQQLARLIFEKRFDYAEYVRFSNEFGIEIVLKEEYEDMFKDEIDKTNENIKK